MIEEAAEQAAKWAENEASRTCGNEQLRLGLIACAVRLRLMASERPRLIQIAAVAEKASIDLHRAANPE
jgi:hypothetical protein